MFYNVVDSYTNIRSRGELPSTDPELDAHQWAEQLREQLAEVEPIEFIEANYGGGSALASKDDRFIDGFKGWGVLVFINDEAVISSGKEFDFGVIQQAAQAVAVARSDYYPQR